LKRDSTTACPVARILGEISQSQNSISSVSEQTPVSMKPNPFWQGRSRIMAMDILNCPKSPRLSREVPRPTPESAFGLAFAHRRKLSCVHRRRLNRLGEFL
jgi:hypothetical protein